MARELVKIKGGAGGFQLMVDSSAELADVQQERQTMDSIYHLLKESQTVTHWCYGHFHQSWHSNIEEILFKMLDIMEFYEIKNIAIMR